MKKNKQNLLTTTICKLSILIPVMTVIFITTTLAQGNKTAPKKAVVKKASVQTGYAPVNGLKMYYEIHGTGKPLVLLHGAYSAIGSSFGKLIPELSKTRKVIAVELQGHGRTADIDRPITYEQMADDIAEFLKYLKIDSADLFGYSMGAGVALQVSIRHPQLARKLVLAAISYKSDGVYPELWELIPGMTPEMFEGSPIKIEYDSLAPNPKHFPMLMAKLKKLDETKYDWKAETIRGLKSPMLLIIGDGDIVMPEHAVEMFKLTGGGVPGDLKPMANSQLAILPGTTHITLVDKAGLLLEMIPPFLDAPVKR
jgi:pimeloyl-ACP methyl ester carboxylesterase